MSDGSQICALLPFCCSCLFPSGSATGKRGLGRLADNDNRWPVSLTSSNALRALLHCMVFVTWAVPQVDAWRQGVTRVRVRVWSDEYEEKSIIPKCSTVDVPNAPPKLYACIWPLISSPVCPLSSPSPIPHHAHCRNALAPSASPKKSAMQVNECCSLCGYAIMYHSIPAPSLKNAIHVPVASLGPPQHLSALFCERRLTGLISSLLKEYRRPGLSLLLSLPSLLTLGLLKLLFDCCSLAKLLGMNRLGDFTPKLKRLVGELLLNRREDLWRHTQWSNINDGNLPLWRVGFLVAC